MFTICNVLIINKLSTSFFFSTEIDPKLYEKRLDLRRVSGQSP